MFAWRPLNRSASWSAPSPGLPSGPDIGNRPGDKSPVPSTMSYQHGPGDPPGDPNANAGMPTVSTLVHPHGFSTTSTSTLVRPETKSDSLIPSDPRHDRGYLQRMRDFFSAALERLGNEEK